MVLLTNNILTYFFINENKSINYVTYNRYFMSDDIGNCRINLITGILIDKRAA